MSTVNPSSDLQSEPVGGQHLPTDWYRKVVQLQDLYAIAIASPDLMTPDESVAQDLYSPILEKGWNSGQSRQEAKVMEEHRNLVEMARRYLQLELWSIRSELAPSFKADKSNFGEEKLIILMTRAYWGIRSLQRELDQAIGLFLSFSSKMNRMT